MESTEAKSAETRVGVESIPIGLSTTTSRTVGESDVYLFAGITGDLDANHTDEEFAKRAGFGGRIAHGALILGYSSAASTKILQDFARPMVSAGYDKVRFLKPVLFGDTLTVVYEIVSVDPRRERIVSSISITNQKDELVLVADHIMQLVGE
jgi:acyl dehydratase